MCIHQEDLLKETGMLYETLVFSFKLVLKMKLICHGNVIFITLLFFVFVYKHPIPWGQGVLQTTFPYAPSHFPFLSLILVSYDFQRLTICVFPLVWLKLRSRKVNVFFCSLEYDS